MGGPRSGSTRSAKSDPPPVRHSRCPSTAPRHRGGLRRAHRGRRARRGPARRAPRRGRRRWGRRGPPWPAAANGGASRRAAPPGTRPASSPGAAPERQRRRRQRHKSQRFDGIRSASITENESSRERACTRSPESQAPCEDDTFAIARCPTPSFLPPIRGSSPRARLQRRGL